MIRNGNLILNLHNSITYIDLVYERTEILNLIMKFILIKMSIEANRKFIFVMLFFIR